MIRLFLTLCGFFVLFLSCTSPDPVSYPEQSIPRPQKQAVSESEQLRAKQVSKCNAFNLPIGKDLPVYVEMERGGFVVVRVEKPCLTEDGIRGAQSQSNWMAMGIPCGGSSGRTRIRGKTYRPKMISFLLSISCPMLPDDLNNIADVAQKTVGIPLNAPLIAYNPLSVQYWEIDGLSDAGVGPEVELRSREAVDVAWKEFSKKERNFSIKLYGRESAWIENHNFYEVKAELSYVSLYEFNLKLLSVEAMDVDGFAAVRKRCKALRPRRNCDKVLGADL